MSKGKADLHLAVVHHLTEELKHEGIEAQTIPLIGDIPPTRNIKLGNSVLAYLPGRRQEFYGAEIVFSLAREMQDILFIILANDGSSAIKLSNIEYHGWVNNLEPIWERTKVYIRPTQHDGLPKLLLEALARGKYAIWSYDFPFCEKAITLEESRQALFKLLNKNAPNVSGSDYVYDNFDPVKIGKQLKDIYLRLS